MVIAVAILVAFVFGLLCGVIFAESRQLVALADLEDELAERDGEWYWPPFPHSTFIEDEAA